MERCENCKHWHGEEAELMRVCVKVSMNTETEGPFIDAWGESAELFTPPDFGCTLFERKGGE